MASKNVALPKKQWTELSNVDCSIQNKTDNTVLLIQDSALPTGTEADQERSKVLKGYQSAVATGLNGEKVYGYTGGDDVSVAVS